MEVTIDTKVAVNIARIIKHQTIINGYQRNLK